MDENKAKNIFEAAGKGKKNPPKPPASSPSSKKNPPPTEISTDHEIINMHKDPEINDMLNRMFRMQEDIQSKLTEIYGSAGISTQQVRTYLDNPSNFSPDIWQKIQSQREILEKKIGDVLKTYAKKQKTGHLIGTPGVVSKERKAKMLGARRNWIPM